MQRIWAQVLAFLAVWGFAEQAAAGLFTPFGPGGASGDLVPAEALPALLVLAVWVAVAALWRARSLGRRLEVQTRAFAGELEQRKATERQLRARDASLRAILDNTDTVAFTLGPDGTILLAEGRGLTSLKRSAKGHPGARFQDVHPERQDLVLLFERCQRGETIQAVVPYSKGTFQLLASPLRRENGTQEGIVGILTDISEMERVRARLAESEERFRSIFENAPYAIVINRISDGAYVAANSVFLHQMGIGREQLHGLVPDILSRMSAEQSQEYLRRAVEQGGLKNKETTLVRPDGSVVHMVYSSAPVSMDGEPCLISVTVDMTARRQAELALKQSEEQYRAIFNNSPIGIYRTTFSGRFVEANPALARMLGYASREELLALVGSLSHDIYPNQAERRRLLGALLASPGGISMEIEFKRRDGSPVFATIHASLQFDADGNPAWLDGTVEDMTPRKRVENALRQSESLLRALKECIPDLVWLKDLDGVYLSCNPVFERFFGAQEREILGRRDHDFVDAELADFFLANDRKAMEAGRPTRNEEKLAFAGTGYLGLFETIKTPMRDASGDIIGVLGIARDITERKERELELQRWMQRFDIVNASAQHVFYDHDLASGDIQWKGATQALLGVTPEEMSGPVQKWVDVLHPEDAPEVLRRAEEVRGRCGRFKAEYRVRHADGRDVHVYESGVFLPDETGRAVQMLGILQDISARKQAEQRLVQSEEKFSKIFALAPYSISIARVADSLLLDVNAAFEALTGYRREEAVGRSCEELGLWRDPAQQADFVARLQREGTVVDFEFVLLRKDGSLRSALNSCQRIEVAGEACSMNFVRDITDMKLVQQTMVLTEKMMSLGGLAAGMAHEINNPLGIISQSVLGVERRLDPGIPANQKEALALGLELADVREYMRRRNILRYLEGIHEAGQRAAEIVRHMLNFSRRSDSGIVDQEPGALVRRALSLAEKDYDLKKKYDFRQIGVRLDISPALLSIPCIPSEIEQVLLNLLRNAAQAMAEAGTKAPAITVRAAQAGEHAVIEVEDNGPGIPQEQLGRVFEPFYTTKGVGEGTGLGLSVSYFIITTTHRGELCVASEPGGGTRFTLKLPLSRPPWAAAT